MRENQYSGIVLKKQPFGEADEIVSIFTKETGKLRLLAKSVKKPSSKLQNFLQLGFLISLRSPQGGRLPRIISAEVIKSFPSLRDSFEKAAAVFSGLEMVLRFTPDQETNTCLFDVLVDFLDSLNELSPEDSQTVLARFKIDFLQAAGLPVQRPFVETKVLYFSPAHGGFTEKVLGRQVDQEILDVFVCLQEAGLNNLGTVTKMPGLKQLQVLLSEYIAYQMDREMLSEKIFPSDML